MGKNLSRKLIQIKRDPILRRWIYGRLIGRYPGEPVYKRHVPPYLEDLLSNSESHFSGAYNFPIIDSTGVFESVVVPLAGQTFVLSPDEPEAVFLTQFEDLETYLSAQRFAWLPLVPEAVNGAWVQKLWAIWSDQNTQPDTSWNWHPYTVAERAINILFWSCRYGLPEPRQKTFELIEIHGHHILENLEFYGDHHTSNHLSNNGRGLFIIGLYLGLEKFIRIGSSILINEAERIFLGSGILREGSSHYHLLLTKNYLTAWLHAEKFNREEKSQLKQIAKNCLSVIPHLHIENHLPLIGDISPDCPPSYLVGLQMGTSKWSNTLEHNDKKKLTELERTIKPLESIILKHDGWLRYSFGGWQGLWHVAPNGWSYMPGHGHQDCASFELHFKGQALFIDPGRGNYDNRLENEVYRSGKTHNSILVDGLDPYAPNKPYYNNKFRVEQGGSMPILHTQDNRVEVCHGGYCRLRGVNNVTRQWEFGNEKFHVTDIVNGIGRHIITQRLITSLKVWQKSDYFILEGNQRKFKVWFSSGRAELQTITNWSEYGTGTPVTKILNTTRSQLPFKSQITVEAG